MKFVINFSILINITNFKPVMRKRIMHFTVIVSCQQITHCYMLRGSMKHEWTCIIAFITVRVLCLQCMETVHNREVTSNDTGHMAEITNGFV
jgi:hypothetical protein